MACVAVAKALWLCFLHSFFLYGGLHDCLVMVGAMAGAMCVAVSVFSPFSLFFAVFVLFLPVSTPTCKVPKICINYQHNTIKCNKMILKHVQMKSKSVLSSINQTALIKQFRQKSKVGDILLKVLRAILNSLTEMMEYIGREIYIIFIYQVENEVLVIL